MTLANDTIHYLTIGGVEGIVSLYTDVADVEKQGLTIQVNGQNRYAKLGAIDDAKATPLRILKDGATYSILKCITPHGSQYFTSSGTFTVPANVSTIYITACAGGGGGGGGGAYYYDWDDQYRAGGAGGSGGATSFGSLLNLQGGGGGGGGGRYAGARGTSYGTAVPNYTSYGNGGAGGSGTDASAGGSGGHGGSCTNMSFNVAAGTYITVTIGAGGGGGSRAINTRASNGGAGTQGFLLVTW